MKLERSTRVIMCVAAGLLGANLIVQTCRIGEARAAGIPDSGAQMQAVVDEVKELNKKVDGLTTFLQSGGLTVKVKKEDESK